MDKTVVLLSGGLDSTVLLYKLLKSGLDCYPITILYGQRHSKEAISARNICEALGSKYLDRWKLVDLSVLKNLLPSSLTGVGDIPEGNYMDESMKSTVVPNRNMILLSIASGYAKGIDARYVTYAAHMGDHPIYPDCRSDFIAEMVKAVKMGTGWENEGIELLAPFQFSTKAQIIELGDKLKVPFGLTWSCYKGGYRSCGLCGTDIERRLAFIEAGVKDPTMYENPLPSKYLE